MTNTAQQLLIFTMSNSYFTKLIAQSGGTGYARFDMRMSTDTAGRPIMDPHTHTPQIYVLGMYFAVKAHMPKFLRNLDVF